MGGLSYPIARAAAQVVQQHLEEHLAAVHGREAPAPDPEAIEELIRAGFWASLRREERRPPRISLALLAPGQATVRLMLENPLPLAPEPLARLAPAVEHRGIHLGVWRGAGGQSQVWGATRALPAHCLVLEVAAPGVLVVKHSRPTLAGKFVNIAVLEGEHIKVVDQHTSAWRESPALLRPLLAPDWSDTEPADVVVRLALAMRAHERGATLLVVPRQSSAWRQSIVDPIRYAVLPPFSALADILREPPDEERRRQWEETVTRAAAGVAGLTAVDGAAIMTDEYDVLAFGATISMCHNGAEVGRIVVTEPILGSEPRFIEAVALGGTRHLSAAQFAHDQHDAVALVASKDGRFTVFGWSPEQNMVRAHRIEALLL